MSDIQYEAGDINKVDHSSQYEDGDVNEVKGSGGITEATLEYLLENVVDEKEEVEIDVEPQGGDRVTYRVHVAPDDMGKVIGKRGRVANAIRRLTKAAGFSEGVNANVDIVD